MQLNKLFFTGFILFTSNVFCFNATWDEFCKAVSSGDLPKVKKLFDKGIDINARSITNCPAIIHAVYSPIMLYFLLTHGANVYARFKSHTVLEMAKNLEHQKSVELINSWIDYLKICKEYYILTICSSSKELLPELSDIISQFCFDDETFAKYIYKHKDEFPRFEDFYDITLVY